MLIVLSLLHSYSMTVMTSFLRTLSWTMAVVEGCHRETASTS